MLDYVSVVVVDMLFTFLVCLASAAEPEKGQPNGYCSEDPSLSISYVNYLKVSVISTSTDLLLHH